MRSRVAAVATWTVVVVMQVTVLLAITVGDFLGRMLEGQAIDRANWYVGIAAVIVISAITVAYATVGALLVARGAGRVGGVLLGGGLAFGTVAFGYVTGGLLVLIDPGSLVANAIFVLGPATIPAAYALILPALALVFPSGRLPGARWRLPVAVATAALAIAAGIRFLTPGPIAGTPSENPFGVAAMPAGLPAVADALTAVGLALFTLLAVPAVILRYRRGDPLERQQLRWFAAAVLLAAIPVGVAPNVGGIAGPIWILAAAVGLLLVPVSVGIAVTRYRLYEIDRLISRGVSWALLTGALVGIYGLAILVLQGLLAGVTQGSTLAVAASTLAAAALFQPLRRRIQHLVDRRFDRARYDAERTASAFAERLRDQVDLDSVARDLRTTVAEAMTPRAATLWLRTRGGER